MGAIAGWEGDGSMTESEESFGEKTMILSPSMVAGRKQPAPPARLVCADGSVLPSPVGKEIVLQEKALSLGRGEENDLVLKADGISRKHVRFFPGDGVWGAEDLGSTNGVVVNSTKVKQTWLKDGDVIDLGRVRYRYNVDAAPAAKGAHADLDLTGAGEKTMVMSGAARKQSVEGARSSVEERAAPAAATPPKAAAFRPPPREEPAPSSGGLGKWLLIIGALVLVAVAIAAFS